MPDLKPYFDAVNAAEEKVQEIANSINDLFTQGTDESTIKALEMRPALEDAQVKHDEAVALYEAMQKANRPNDVAKNFVPVSSTDPVEGNQPTVIKRQDYDRMSLVDRASFVKSGGKLED